MLLHLDRLFGVVRYEVVCAVGGMVVLGACDAARTPGAAVTEGAPSASQGGSTQVSPASLTEDGVSEVSVGPNGSSPLPPVSPPPASVPGSSSDTQSNPAPSSTESSGATSADSSSSGVPVIGTLGTFICPAPPYTSGPVWDGATAERVAGVPPADGFTEATDTVILEGPLWWDGSLYFSQINSGTPVFGRPGNPVVPLDAGSAEADAGPSEPPRPPPSRLLRLSASGEVAVIVEDAGTNGLALDRTGRLLAANHKTGSIGVMTSDGQTAEDLVSTYDGIRFNSPNDLTVGKDGTVYFTDPDYQAPLPAPQAEMRAYRVAPGTNTAIPIIEGRRQPNGITLSPNGETLYVSASDGLVAYPVMPDGSVGTGEPFAQGVVRSSDGMAADCAGNLYTTSGQSVLIVDASGAEVGRIAVAGVQSVTNVAFGGPEHKTVYITTLGAGSNVGLFRYDGQLPGLPY